MTQVVPPNAIDDIIYPESDGKPMSDNTRQFWLIIMIAQSLAAYYADREDVFVAGDLLWYPVKGDIKIRTAPDAMVAFGRPPGHRGSYVQHREDGIAPQVVFEILSPSNTATEMAEKLDFYARYGVEEYYEYDPDLNLLRAWQRQDDWLWEVDTAGGWASPLLGVRLSTASGDLLLYRPNGTPFWTYNQLQEAVITETQRANTATQHAQAAAQRADAATQRAQAAAQRAQAATQRAQAQTQRAQAAAQRADAAVQRAAAEAQRTAELAAELAAERARAAKLAAKLRELGLEETA